MRDVVMDFSEGLSCELTRRAKEVIKPIEEHGDRYLVVFAIVCSFFGAACAEISNRDECSFEEAALVVLRDLATTAKDMGNVVDSIHQKDCVAK